MSEEQKKDENGTNGTALEKSNSRFIISTKKFGIAARLENATVLTVDAAAKVPNRLGIVFDDSGSMSGEGIAKAHEAIEAFVKNCNSNDTSLALYPLNAAIKSLTLDYAGVAMYGMSIPATGGTPLYSKLKELLSTEPITRAIAFSDGQPGDTYGKASCIEEYRNKKIPIDTIFIGQLGYGDTAMKELAEMTGGIFMHFVDASTLAKSFKYLTPAYRALLMSPEFKAKVERGEV